MFTVFYLQASTKTDNPEKPGQEVAPIHRIRITLTSRNVRSLEKGRFLYLYVIRIYMDHACAQYKIYVYE